MAVDIPHFSLPFRFGPGGHADVAEQDSIDDVANCVEAVLRTRVGERAEHPLFGSTDLLFQQEPLDTDTLVQQVEEWEPRAVVSAEEVAETVGQLQQRVRVLVATAGDN